MNIFSQIKISPSLLMNKFSSVFLASDNVITTFLDSDNFITRLLRSFLQIFYFACKWVMYVVDVIYFYVLELAGVGSDTSAFDAANSDLTFKLLLDNKEIVTTIVRNFIAIAIVLILVAAIIAIIKQQSNALKESGGKEKTSDVLRRTFKSVMLIILTPLIAILGIVASSVILQSLFKATNITNAKSLSARVFTVSASTANRYKQYAENGERIPIVYKFSGTSKQDAISYAVTMAGNETYPSLDYFDKNLSLGGSSIYDPVDNSIVNASTSSNKYTAVENWRYNTYYKYFDSAETYDSESAHAKYRVIDTHASEYYAMSDVICYALDTMEEFYFVTIQELLETLVANNPDKFENVVKDYNIRIMETSGNPNSVTGADNSPNIAAMKSKIQNKSYGFIRYTSTYTSGTYEYVHVKDAVDEIDGAKFVIAYRLTDDNGGITRNYYMPLVNVTKVGDNDAFKSDYIKNNCMITARGIFDTAGYPTAIRKTASGNIMFYRDDLQLATEGSMSDVATIDQIELEEEVDQEAEEQSFFEKVGSAVKGAWSSVKKFVTNIFNPLKLVPDLSIDESKLATTYTKVTTSVYTMEDGKLQISYFFSDSITSKLSLKLYGMNLNNLFEPMNINYVTLIFGSVVMFKIMVTAIFALVNRAMNLFIMFLIYPIACATIPMEEGDAGKSSGSYKKWSQKFTQLLFSTYGLILGINVVFIIIPVIDTIEFFKVSDFVDNKALGRIGNALVNPWKILNLNNSLETTVTTYSTICWIVNKLLRIIFQIAAFSLVSGVGKGGGDTFTSVIQTVVGVGPGALEDSPLDAVKKTIKSTTKAINMVLNPAKVVKDTVVNSADKIKKTAKDLLPGSAIAAEAIDKAKQLTAFTRGLAGNVSPQQVAEIAKKASSAAAGGGDGGGGGDAGGA